MGERYVPKGKRDQKWEPDFAEPTLVDAAVYSALHYFKENPSINYISFSVQDSWVYPTGGKMEEFLKSYPSTVEGKRQGYTEANIEFLNKVAQRLRSVLPENGIKGRKTIVYIAYGEVNRIPKIRIDPDVLPVTVYQIATTLMDSVYSEGAIGKKEYRLSEWAKVTNRIGNHDWAEGRGFIYPRIYTNLVEKFVRTVQKDKMNFDYAHIEAYPNWSLDGPKLYFMGRIYWNPNVDTDSLLTLFCSDMFGKGAPLIRLYFKTLEDFNSSMNNDPKRERRLGSYITQLQINQKESSLIAKAALYIQKAKAITTNDLCKERIDFFSRGFKISQKFFDLYKSTENKSAKAEELKEYLQKEVAGNEMMLNMATENDFLAKMDDLIDKIANIKK